ncbi:MAG: SRPBCC family protein, partial [Phycisphaerae bacterium]|nr:SRPBCC family protein [Phycisphaerae bacterium]
SDIPNLPETMPDVVKIEFLTDQRVGLGTKFRETRRMGKREMVTELDVTEFVENDHVRMVADSHGTIWDTLFEVTPTGGGTELTLTMDARAHKLLPRIMNPIMKGFFKKGIEKHLDSLKTHCEDKAAAR